MALLSLSLVLTIHLAAALQIGPDFSNNFGRPGANTTFDCESPRFDSIKSEDWCLLDKTWL